MYAPRKTNPSMVTEFATFLFVASIVIAVLAILVFIFYTSPWSYVIGIMAALLAALPLIDGLALFMGQSWALTIGGYGSRAWTQAPDVREHFGLPPAHPAYPSSALAVAPSSPTCPKCGQPLMHVQQYRRLYRDREQKYLWEFSLLFSPFSIACVACG